MASPLFWNLLAKTYSRSKIGDPAAYQAKLDTTARYLGPQMRMLEVGCGTGTTAVHHAPRVASVLGIDFSPRMIAIARDRAAAAGAANATFEVGRLENLPAPAQAPQASQASQAPQAAPAYDVVLAMSILHLVPDAGATLRHLARQLVPGGMLFSSTICIGDTPGAMSRILPLIRFVGLPPVKSLTEADLVAAHEAAGFEIIERLRPRPNAAVFFGARLRDQSAA